VSVDVRVVAATNRNPLEQVRKGDLREDLYYRLNVLPIVVPPLRERKEDIPLLAGHFLARCADRCGRSGLVLEPAAVDALVRHAWPGNVRELENFIERLAVLSPGPTIGAADVRFDVMPSVTAPLGEGDTDPANGALTEMERIEKAAIARALAAAGGNVRDAAQSLGLGQATVYRKVKKYGLSTR
jgi:transcriptional regulator with PAS, ATPase and Fis domain